jgi:hypothetical protein
MPAIIITIQNYDAILYISIRFYLFYPPNFINLRAVLAKLSKKNKQYIELAILIFIAVLSFLLWNTVIIFPIKLFTVLLHEIGHGLFAIITGGSIKYIELNINLGGKCVTNGGVSFVVASAGYLGSLLWGSLLFISAYKKTYSLWITSIIAVIIILFTANFMQSTFGALFALIFAALLLISPRYFPTIVNKYLLKILGFISCLYIIFDIKEDLLTTSLRPTDAQTIANIAGGPAFLWGLIWFIISITVLFILLRYSYKKGMT